MLLCSLYCVEVANELNNYEYPDVYTMYIQMPAKEKTIEQKIMDMFPEEPEIMLAVAMAESNLNPEAYNPEAHRGCQGSIGIMQIACLHTDDPDKLFDVDYNLQVAREIYDREGLRPWGAYTDKRYLAYLN